MADGTEFQIDIDVPAAGTSSAADAVERLQSQLTAAGEAATAASEAVKAGQASYAAAEAAANKAAAAVEKIGIAAEAQRGKLAKALETGDENAIARAEAALGRLTAKQTEAVAKAEAAKSALAGEAAALDKLKASASAAEAAEDKLTKAHKEAADVAKAQEKAAAQAAANFGKTNEIAEGLGKLGGPAGVAGQKIFGLAEGFKKLGSSLGAAGPYVAIAIAFIAIATAAITATAALTAYAVKLAEANRTQSLLYQGMVQSVAGGTELEKRVDSLSKRVPLAQDKLRSMASDLAKTGLRGKELGDALEAAAVKASEQEFGPDWQKQVNSIAKQSELFQRNIAKLFGGLNVDKLLEGFAKLVGLFDETSATGKAIKVVFDSLMQPLIDGLTELVPVIVRAFIQFEIWALKALIAIKPYGSTIAAVAKGLAVVAVVAGVLVVALVAAVAVGAAFLTVVSTVWRVIIDWAESMVRGAQAAWELGGAIIDGAGAAFDWLMGKATGVIDWLSSLSLADIGSDLILGLAQGLLGGGPAILNAITGVVGGAIDAAKGLLGIASPSKVFAEIGMNTAAGMTEGVDAGRSDVQASLGALVNPTDATSPIAATAPAAEAKGASGGNTFIFNGVKDAEDAIDRFLSVLEGAADSLGTGTAEAPNG